MLPGIVHSPPGIVQSEFVTAVDEFIGAGEHAEDHGHLIDIQILEFISLKFPVPVTYIIIYPE